jgi:hypothetical protein
MVKVDLRVTKSTTVTERSDIAIPGKDRQGTLDLHNFRSGPARLDPGRHIAKEACLERRGSYELGVLMPKPSCHFLDLR